MSSKIKKYWTVGPSDNKFGATEWLEEKYNFRINLLIDKIELDIADKNFETLFHAEYIEPLTEATAAELFTKLSADVKTGGYRSMGLIDISKEKADKKWRIF